MEDIGPDPQTFDLETATVRNPHYRAVAWSGKYLQLTLMSIPVGEDIGLEAHPDTDQFLRLYPVSSDADAARAAHEACADEINWNMRQWAAAQAKLGKKGYTYFFTRVPTINGQPSPQGATHTADISYAFDNPKGQPTQTWNEIDTRLGDMMSSYWVNFITKGDPNGGGLPQWPQYKSLTTGKVMVLGDAPQVEAAAPVAKLQFYQTAYQRMLRTSGTN